MHSTKRRLLATSMTVLLLLAAAAPALVSGAFHGVAVSKATDSPLNIGDAYTSTARLLNIVDGGQDTVRVTGLTDTIQSAGGAVATGNIMPTTGLIFGDAGLLPGTATVTCTGGSGLGTAGSPYIGATECLVGFDGTITTVPFSHYTVQAADFNLPDNRLTDRIEWSWNNTCISDPDNDCTTNPQTASASASALILPPGNGGPCPAPPAAFGLGAAGGYTVLVLEGGKITISAGDTRIVGDVGMTKNSWGDLLKATIDGDLYLDPLSKPKIHTKDLNVTGSVITKDMSAEHADALAANLALATLAPTQTFGTLTNSTTISGGPGMNVISLGGVNMVKKTLTIAGDPSSMFVFNVTGGFNFANSQMVLTGGVDPNNIIWNFIGTGADIDIFKAPTIAYGTFLAPYRNIEQHESQVFGRFIGATTGFQLKVISGAQITCP